MSYYRPTSAASSSSSSVGTLAKDTELGSPPLDSISCLSFSPVANHLSVSSWDGKVRIYDVLQQTKGVGIAAIEFGGPALATDWAKDGRKVVGCSADKTAMVIDLGANGAPAQKIAVHDSPIKSAKFAEVSGTEILVTGSWDRTIKYWDMRSPNPVGTVQFSERVYAMDVKDKLLVVALADLQIAAINLDSPGVVYKNIASPLKHQTRAVTCFKEADGFMIASIEARCAFQHIDAKDSKKNLTFKCHRDTGINSKETKCWTVNALSTHPIWGTFSTAGSDGTFHFWDKESRTRLKGYPSAGGPISATAFNHDGTTFAYAVSYDWHMGYSGNTVNHPNKVMLHTVIDEEVRPKSMKGR